MELSGVAGPARPCGPARTAVVDHLERELRPASQRACAVEAKREGALAVLQLEPVMAEYLLRHLHAHAAKDNGRAAARAALVIQRYLCTGTRDAHHKLATSIVYW